MPKWDITAILFSGAMLLTTVILTTSAMSDELKYGRCAKHIVVPKGVKRLKEPHFRYIDCSIAESVTFSEGLETIGYSAFEGSHIKVFNLPKSVHTIEDDAFSYSHLEEINLSNVEHIGSAFDRSNLKETDLSTAQ